MNLIIGCYLSIMIVTCGCLYCIGATSMINNASFHFPRCLGPCLALCPEYSFILEDELGVCGCVLGILDVRSFAKRCQASWIPAMRDKYPPKLNGAHPNTQVNTWVLSSHKKSVKRVLLIENRPCKAKLWKQNLPAVTPSGFLCEGLITAWEAGDAHS